VIGRACPACTRQPWPPCRSGSRSSWRRVVAGSLLLRTHARRRAELWSSLSPDKTPSTPLFGSRSFGQRWIPWRRGPWFGLMKCSQIKCIVNTISVHGRLRPGRVFLKRPDGVVCEHFLTMATFTDRIFTSSK